MAQTDVYTQVKDLLAKAGIDWAGDTIKVAFVDSGYTFNAADTSSGSILASYEITGDGYTAGGFTLAGKSASGGVLDATDLLVANGAPANNFSFRRTLVYKVGTVAGVVDPVLCSHLMIDSPAPADRQVVSADYTIVWPADGVLNIADA